MRHSQWVPRNKSHDASRHIHWLMMFPVDFEKERSEDKERTVCNEKKTIRERDLFCFQPPGGKLVSRVGRQCSLWLKLLTLCRKCDQEWLLSSKLCKRIKDGA